MVTGSEKYRVERDSMGEMKVPAGALWGASTERAVRNFPVSGERMPRRLIHAIGVIKEAAAATHARSGALDSARAEAIRTAAREVARGDLDEHFVVDVFQTGSGTSTNMNANEVIANRANRILGGREDTTVHPNDHVNAGQSSNDVMPSALHVAARLAIHEDLLPALARLRDALAERADAFAEVLKIGRTHLMDATPVRLGQEFGGYARQVEEGMRRAEAAREALAELALGGTAVGTGLNCPPGFAGEVVRRISEETGLEFTEAGNHFEAQAGRDAAVEASGALKTIAVSLYKIANDLRLLASGPRCGLGEISLPAIQPGSSIMPGKVNPVICESVTQVAVQVIGNDAAVAIAGLSGQLELNVFIPVIARNLLLSIRLLANVSRIFVDKCIEGIEANREHATALVERSLAMVTALAPVLGYDRAAELAKEAFASGRTIREVCLEHGVLPPDRLDELLDPESQVGPASREA